MYVDEWCFLYFFPLFTDFRISEKSRFFIYLGDFIKWRDLYKTTLSGSIYSDSW